ncbi:MAG: LysR family transcriptional regulator [Erysipelotrichaceae bacterium]|nr:LysR family transcriptional regulator [Erysipelotrichaceae bacterium]
MQLKTIESFIITAKSTSFASAAEKLYISVPALTKQINNFENELGLTLFTRTNRGISLTAAGKYLLNNISPQLESLNRVIENTKSIFSDRKKNLIIGVYGSDISTMIPSFFKHFLPAQPETQLSYTFIRMNEIDRKLLNHEIDICFIYGYDSQKHDKNLSYLEILQDEPICIVPKQLSISQKRNIKLEDLINERLLIVNYGNDIFHDAIHKEIDSKNLPIDIIPVEEGMVDGQLKLSINPLIFIASRLSVSHNNNIEYIPFDFHGKKIPIGIIFRKEDGSYIKDTVYSIAKKAFETTLKEW